MPSAEPFGRICFACKLGLAKRASQYGVVSLHPDKQMGPWICRWLHTIRVVQLQALSARRLMSSIDGDFPPALRLACGGVDWTRLIPADGAAGGGGRPRDGAGAASLRSSGIPAMPGRVPPSELLDWGSNKRIGTDITALGRWLTDGETLPNVVLVSPTVATALGLHY